MNPSPLDLVRGIRAANEFQPVPPIFSVSMPIHCSWMRAFLMSRMENKHIKAEH